MNATPRLLVIGAHPDDCELKAGGLAALYRQLGYSVKFVSMTSGNAGHHELPPAQLAQRRQQECAAVSRLTGVEYEILGYDDGKLEASIETRMRLIGLIRSYRPDLVLTHRPNDYHPDHRTTSTLVCDAAYLVIVPHLVPEVPALRINPVIMYLSDHFQRPAPFAPTVALDVGPVYPQILDQLACHESQLFEWLPYTLCEAAPQGAAARRDYLERFYQYFNGPLRTRHRDVVESIYGAEAAAKIEVIEAFEPCEYGSPLTPELRSRLFPMLPVA